MGSVGRSASAAKARCLRRHSRSPSSDNHWLPSGRRRRRPVLLALLHLLPSTPRAHVLFLRPPHRRRTPSVPSPSPSLPLTTVACQGPRSPPLGVPTDIVARREEQTHRLPRRTFSLLEKQRSFARHTGAERLLFGQVSLTENNFCVRSVPQTAGFSPHFPLLTALIDLVDVVVALLPGRVCPSHSTSS